MITITINDKEIQLEKPITILEAAKANGIKIPHFCHHPVLEQWGGCRMCLVEVEKMPRLQTACTLYVTDGMKIKTESDVISSARRSVLEFILINHPLDCPVCDKGGECKLQDYVMQYGASSGRFKEGKIRHPESLKDHIVVRNPERCIMCTRCVRMCDGIQGASAIAINKRGNHSVMEPFSGEVYECEYCGNCLTVCPVGAIMSKLHRYSYRPWQLTGEVKTTCSFCGVGCSLFVQVRDNAIKRVVPQIGVGINKGLLCSRGRFGYEYVGNPDRLTTPLIRKNGKLEPASWEEALATVAHKLNDIKNSSGGKAIAAVASARCTNEDNYALQKLIRGLGSNNIDSTARLGIAGAVRVLEGMLGAGATANPISDISNADVLLISGGDPTQINPVLGLEVRSSHRKGSKVITTCYAPGLKRYRAVGTQGDSEDAVLRAILGVLVKDKSIAVSALESYVKSLDLSPALSGALSVTSAAGLLEGASSPAVVIGREAMQKSGTLFVLAAIANLTKAKVYLLSERPNEMGIIDLGCLPDTMPGGNPVPAGEEGLSLMEMISEAGKSIRAMYVMGENPAFNLPGGGTTVEALKKLDFLVVQDIFLTETAELAHVVLPARAWSEKDGTYTNLERRVQRLRKAIDNPGCMDDHAILIELGRRLGVAMPEEAEIMADIKRVSPLHRNLSDADIDNGKAVWPYGGIPAPVREISSSPSQSAPIAGGKVYLAVEKPLFHSGTLSRRSPAMRTIYPKPVVKVGPSVAEKFGLRDGADARVSTDKGELILEVKIDAELGSTVLVTNNFKENGALGLMGYSVDPITKTPDVSGCEVRISAEGKAR